MDHYKVVNTTRKPGVRKGPHRLGFFIALGDKRPFGPGKSHVINTVTPGILNLQQKGYISIEPVKDINVVIKKQIEENSKIQKKEEQERTEALVSEKKVELEKVQTELKEVVKPKSFAETIDSGLNKEEMKEKAKQSHGRVTAAKVDGDSSDPLGDLEEAVNPTGEPNFVVQAKAKKGSRRNK